MPNPPTPPQSSPSSYTWGRLMDMQRRLGGASLALTGQDQLDIVNQVSSFAYTRYPWPFTLATTPLGSIPCVNLQQDYPAPSDLRAITRAWFAVPNTVNALNDGTVPPYDDPATLALIAAELSADYVNGLGYPGGVPAYYTYPPNGSLSIQKRLPVNLIPAGYTAIREIAQQPNNGLVRLTCATAVNLNQPYSLEMEYQPVRPPVNALTEKCWFPDDYVAIGQAGLLYYIYLYNNDPRAGVSTFNADGSIAYSGQLARWMGAMESAAAAEREGSVSQFAPEDSLGSDYGTTGWWFA